MTPPPLSLYVHFPWCITKCPYCDFNSHARRAPVDERGYVDALLRDFDRDLARHDCGARELTSVFLGGGTPSLFGGGAVARLLDGVDARLALGDAEVTLEANPGAVEHDDFAAYRAAGVNRLSLGAQSFDDDQLRNLGRVHRAREIHDAVDAAGAHFANINIDLMHGLPAQTVAAALADLQTALACSPTHLSLYQLTIEPNTWFYRHPPALPDDDAVLEMQRALFAAASARGFARYEVSAHARAGAQCRHNLNYWRFGDYLGVGAGAHGKVSVDGVVRRYAKPKHPARYLAGVGDGDGDDGGGVSTVAGDELLFEFLLNALRLTDGFDIQLIKSRTGHDADAVTKLLTGAIDDGMVINDGRRVKCTPHGYKFLDEVLQGVLPKEKITSPPS